MKKILLVTERFWPEEFVVNDLAVEAARRGYEITVLTQQPSYPRGRMPRGYRNAFLSRERWQGVDVIRFKTVLGYRESLFYKLLNYAWFVFCGSLVALSIGGRFDSVLIYQTGPLTMSVPGIIYAKSRRVPVTIWTQDVWPDSVYAYGFKRSSFLSHALDAFVAWVYGSMSAILVSCKGFVNALKRHATVPVVYAPNWPLSPYNEPVGIISTSSIPVFLFAGNVGKVQNLENVIKAYAVACGTPRFKGILRIVGDGSALDQLKGLAEALKAPVEFLGRKHSSVMSEEYARADYLVLSLDDQPVFRLTVPSKFQMYLSVGKPMLCAAEGEVRSLVRELGLGIDADAGSVDSIAAAFGRLAGAEASEVAKWGKNARSAFEGAFNREQIIDTILATMV